MRYLTPAYSSRSESSGRSSSTGAIAPPSSQPLTAPLMGVDFVRIADYRLDRIFRAGLQVGRLECFDVPVTVGSLDFEFECRPLRYENGFIPSCGHR